MDLAALFVLSVLIILSVFPLYWMVVTSFKSTAQTFTIPPEWFFKPTLEHYRNIVEAKNIVKTFVNSLTVSLLGTFFALLLGLPAAYSLARFQFKGKNHVWFWIITNRMLSPIALALPFFLLGRKLALLDTRLYLIIIYLTFNLPMVIWIMIGFFQAIPRELEEAAVVEGATSGSAFIKVILPLAAPGIVVTAIFCVIFSWNELLYALVLTRMEARTMPVVASTFMTGMGIQWGGIAATGTLIVLPILIFSFLVSRYLVRGLTLGAIK